MAERTMTDYRAGPILPASAKNLIQHREDFEEANWAGDQAFAIIAAPWTQLRYVNGTASTKAESVSSKGIASAMPPSPS